LGYRKFEAPCENQNMTALTSIFFSTSIPLITCPNTTCLPSNLQPHQTIKIQFSYANSCLLYKANTYIGLDNYNCYFQGPFKFSSPKSNSRLSNFKSLLHLSMSLLNG
jgi:hypothetical protein